MNQVQPQNVSKSIGRTENVNYLTHHSRVIEQIKQNQNEMIEMLLLARFTLFRHS